MIRVQGGTVRTAGIIFHLLWAAYCAMQKKSPDSPSKENIPILKLNNIIVLVSYYYMRN